MISMPSTPTYTPHTTIFHLHRFPGPRHLQRFHFSLYKFIGHKNVSKTSQPIPIPAFHLRPPHEHLNLYQYLHFTSDHPMNIFKAIIKGECINMYIRTNTTYETYATMVHTFKAQLHKRNYPNTLINNIIATVKYSDRQQYLQNGQPIQPTMTPPLYRHTPPPQYRLLKQLVLHDYHMVRFKTPRFITLRHPTLQSMLVRSHKSFINDQLVDVILMILMTLPF